MTTRGRTASSGFTLVELTISIAFLGTLLLLSSAIIVQIISIYNKGVAVKQINEAGRSLAEDINRLSSSGFQVNMADDGKTGYLCIKDSNRWRAYVWSSAFRGSGTSNPPTDSSAKRFTLNGNPVSLVRTNDGVDGSAYCQLPTGSANIAMNPSEVTPLLTQQVRVLSVDVTSPNVADPTLQSLRRVTFWIGTFDGNGNVPGMTPTATVTGGVATKWTCQGGNLGNFCAVSKFETVIYTPNSEGW